MSSQERNAAVFRKLGLSEEEASIVLHALGIQLYARGYSARSYSTGGWRNYFCTSTGADTYPICRRLVDLGWMYMRVEGKGSGFLQEDTYVFSVTHAGKMAVTLAGFELREDE